MTVTSPSQASLLVSVRAADRVLRTAAATTRVARAARKKRTRRKKLRNGTARNKTCHHVRRRNRAVDGAMTSLSTYSTTKTAHSTQVATTSEFCSAVPGVAASWARTTATKSTPSTAMTGWSRW